jgi:DNA-binding protein HU-beta
MSKSDIIAEVAEISGLSKQDSEKAVNAFLTAVENGLKKGEKIAFMGFGTFEVKARAARTGKNPRTGEAISIAASKLPVFKAGKGLKTAISE